MSSTCCGHTSTLAFYSLLQPNIIESLKHANHSSSPTHSTVYTYYNQKLHFLRQHVGRLEAYSHVYQVKSQKMALYVYLHALRGCESAYSGG